MSIDITFEDIEFVVTELRKYGNSHPKNLNITERSFVSQMDYKLQLDTLPTEEQLKWLYRMYFNYIEGDEDGTEYEAWCGEHGFTS